MNECRHRMGYEKGYFGGQEYLCLICGEDAENVVNELQARVDELERKLRLYETATS